MIRQQAQSELYHRSPPSEERPGEYDVRNHSWKPKKEPLSYNSRLAHIKSRGGDKTASLDSAASYKTAVMNEEETQAMGGNPQAPPRNRVRNMSPVNSSFRQGQFGGRDLTRVERFKGSTRPAPVTDFRPFTGVSSPTPSELDMFSQTAFEPDKDDSISENNSEAVLREAQYFADPEEQNQVSTFGFDEQNPLEVPRRGRHVDQERDAVLALGMTPVHVPNLSTLDPTSAGHSLRPNLEEGEVISASAAVLALASSAIALHQDGAEEVEMDDKLHKDSSDDVDESYKPY